MAINKKVLKDEDAVIGDLKRPFVNRNPKRQVHNSYSASQASGSIALGYYRGLAEGRKEAQKYIDYWKNKYLKLKAKK